MNPDTCRGRFIAPNNRRKHKRAPASTTNNNASKKPASQRPRQPAQHKQETGEKLATQGTIPLESDLDDTIPRMKIVSPPPVEAEPEVSPQELEVNQTDPRIKAITIPLVEPELALTASERATCHPERSRSEEHTSELQSLRHLVCR